MSVASNNNNVAGIVLQNMRYPALAKAVLQFCSSDQIEKQAIGPPPNMQGKQAPIPAKPKPIASPGLDISVTDPLSQDSGSISDYQAFIAADTPSTAAATTSPSSPTVPAMTPVKTEPTRLISTDIPDASVGAATPIATHPDLKYRGISPQDVSHIPLARPPAATPTAAGRPPRTVTGVPPDVKAAPAAAGGAEPATTKTDPPASDVIFSSMIDEFSTGNIANDIINDDVRAKMLEEYNSGKITDPVKAGQYLRVLASDYYTDQMRKLMAGGISQEDAAKQVYTNIRGGEFGVDGLARALDTITDTTIRDAYGGEPVPQDVLDSIKTKYMRTPGFLEQALNTFNEMSWYDKLFLVLGLGGMAIAAINAMSGGDMATSLIAGLGGAGAAGWALRDPLSKMFGGGGWFGGSSKPKSPVSTSSDTTATVVSNITGDGIGSTPSTRGTTPRYDRSGFPGTPEEAPETSVADSGGYLNRPREMSLEPVLSDIASGNPTTLDPLDVRADRNFGRLLQQAQA